MIRSILTHFRERAARKRLAEIVAQTRASYECQDYTKRRRARLAPERQARIASLIEGIPGIARERGEA
jgi:hypothetical protein